MNSHLKLKNRLKQYRQKTGMTQTQLAKEVGSSKNTISSIETGSSVLPLILPICFAWLSIASSRNCFTLKRINYAICQ